VTGTNYCQVEESSKQCHMSAATTSSRVDWQQPIQLI